MTTETIEQSKPQADAKDQVASVKSRSSPAPTPQEFFRKLTERPDIQELLRRLAKR